MFTKNHRKDTQKNDYHKCNLLYLRYRHKQNNFNSTCAIVSIVINFIVLYYVIIEHEKGANMFLLSDTRKENKESNKRKRVEMQNSSPYWKAENPSIRSLS